MKTLGLLGGMSWESTVPYYQIINRAVNQRLGGLHSARLVLHSVDFDDIEKLQHAGAWDEAARILAAAAAGLEAAGAQGFLLCTNTMHKVAEEVEAAVSIPLLHIADATARAVRAAGHSVVGLLGTRFTMEQEFYRGRLERQHGLRVVIPSARDRETVHRVIYEELCLGQILEASRRDYDRIIETLIHQGAEGVILGCTEIGLLVDDRTAPVPLFDTTEIHALSAVDWALE